MRPLWPLALAAFLGSAVAQTSTPDGKAAEDTPPKPRPPLKLKLDDIDPAQRRYLVGTQDSKKAADKKEAAAGANLPGLGGPRTNSWERPSSEVFPRDSGPDSKLPY